MKIQNSYNSNNSNNLKKLEKEVIKRNRKSFEHLHKVQEKIRTNIVIQSHLEINKKKSTSKIK